MEAAMPCELKTTKSSYRHRKTDSGSNKSQKTEHACIVESHESTRKCLERTLPKDHGDQSHRGERGQFDESLKSCAQVRSHAPSGDNSGCKSSKRSSKIDQGEEQKGGYSGNTKRQKEGPLCYTDGLLSSQKRGDRTEVSKVQRPGSTPR